jgi:hypothetical protein
MTDHLREEQEMEAEALAAIFPDTFEIRSASQPFVWSIKLVPIDTGGDESLDEKQNYVGIRLVATIPLNYPEEVGPELDIEIVKVRYLFFGVGGDAELLFLLFSDRCNHVALLTMLSTLSIFFKGLAEEQRLLLLELALAAAEANMGMPSIFSCCEVLREWLLDNNFKGQDDGSMYAQMMRKAKELEKSKVCMPSQSKL